MNNIVLKSIDLTNFMTFKKKHIDFSDNVTLIIGKNGTGKSSVLEAISISFNLKDRSSSVKDFINNKAEPANASIDLLCEVDGVQTHIITQMSAEEKERKEYKIVKRPGFDDLKGKAASQYIESIITKDQIKVMSALQGNNRFIQNSAGDNLKTLAIMFNTRFDDEVRYLLDKEKIVKADLANLTNKVATLGGALESKQAFIESIAKELSKISIPTDTDSYVIEHTEAEVTTKNAELLGASNTENSLKEKLKAGTSNFTTLSVTLDKLRSDHATYEAALKSKSAELTEALNKRDTTDYTAAISDISEAIKELRHKYSLGVSAESEARAKVKTVTERIKLFEKGLCPTCGGDVKAKVAFDTSEKASAEALLKDIGEKLSAIGKDIADRENEYSSFIKKKNAADVNNNTIVHLQSSVEELQSKVNDTEYATTIENLENQLKNYDQVAIEKLKAEITAAENYVASLKSNIAELNATIKSLQAHRVEVEAAKVEYQSKVSMLETAKEELSAISTNLTENRKELDRTSETVEAISKAARETLPNVSRAAMKSICENLSALCTEIVQLFNYESMTVEVIDGGGVEFSVKKMEGVKVTHQMASSFEKNLMNLALVISLCRTMKIDFICIDEIDSAADEDNKTTIGSMVELLLTQTHTQLVTITHDRNLMTYLTTNLEGTKLERISGE